MGGSTCACSSALRPPVPAVGLKEDCTQPPTSSGQLRLEVDAAEGRGVHVLEMIGLVEDLEEELPVALDLELAAAGGHQLVEAPRGVQGVEGAEPFVDTGRLVAQGHEREPAAFRRAELHEPHVGAAKAPRRGHAGGAAQSPVQGVGPAVKGAADACGVAAAFQKLRAAVPAGVRESPKPPLLVAEDDQRDARELEGRVVARRAPLVGAGDAVPAPSQEAGGLGRQRSRIRIAKRRKGGRYGCVFMHAAQCARHFLAQPGGRVHRVIPLAGPPHRASNPCVMRAPDLACASARALRAMMPAPGAGGVVETRSPQPPTALPGGDRLLRGPRGLPLNEEER